MNLADFLTQTRKLAEAATPGPWLADLGNWQVESRNKDSFRDGVCCFTPSDRDRCDGSPNPIDPVDDAFFIAAARTALPKALEMLEAAVKELRGCAEDRHYYGVYPRHSECLRALDEIAGKP